MRKLFLFLILLVAAPMLLLPRIVGGIAEHQVEGYVASFNDAAMVSDGPRITEYEYRRGWFDANSRQRIALHDEGDSEPVFLVVDSVVRHGPLVRRSGFGIAEIRSQFSLEDTVETVELPLTAITRIHLDGSASSVVAGDRIDHRFAESDSRLQWDGGELKVQVGANGSSIAAVGDVGKLLLSQADNRITFGPIAISGDQRQTSHQFWLGDSKFSIAELGVVDTVDGSVTIEKLGIESNASLDHDRLAYSLLINADRIATPAFSDGRLNFRVALADLDVDATAKVRDKYATGTGPAGDPDWSEIEADMLALLAQGGRLDVERLFFSNEEGRLDATARLRLEEKPDAPVLVELLLAMEGQVDIVVSKDLLASAAENNPQLAQAASMLYTAGYLLEEDEDFVLKAIYANGLLTINGLPLPLPLPIR